MQRNGEISIWETADGEPVFILNLPPTHVVGSLREPVFLLEPVQKKLYITGKLQTNAPFCILLCCFFIVFLCKHADDVLDCCTWVSHPLQCLML